MTKKEKSLVTIEANQLDEVDVRAISFVKRGANQSPFKIFKTEDVETQKTDTEDKRMINFGFDWLKSKSTDEEELIIEPDAQLSAVIIPDNDKADQLTEIVKSNDFPTEHVEKKDGSIIFKHDDKVQLDKLTYFKANDNVIVGVSHVQKAFDPFSTSGSFAEDVQKNSFLPGVSIASSIMQDKIFDILVSSEKSEDMVKSVKSTLKEFSEFVIGLAQSVPAEAFKFEKVKLEEKETQKEETVEKTDDEKAVAKDDLGEALAASLEDDSAGDAVQADTAPDKEVEGKAKEEELGSLISTAEEKMKGVTDKLAGAVDALAKSIEKSNNALNERLSQIENKLKENEEKVKSAYDAIDNAVLGTINSDYANMNSTGVRKGDKELTELDDEFWSGTLRTVDN